MRVRLLSLCAIAVFSLGLARSANAATIFFTDRTAWEAAVSNIVTETYESYAWSAPPGFVFLGSSTTLGDYSYANGQAEIFGIDSDVYTGDAAYLTGNYLEWEEAIPNTLRTVILSGATTALGFDFGQFTGSVNSFVLSLGNGDSTLAFSNLNEYAFLGAVSTVPFSSFSITSDPFPLIDTLSRADAVPEPATLLMFGTGLLGAAARRRATRKR